MRSSFRLHAVITECSIDNITYYKCDVSKWEEVEAVSKKIIEEVRRYIHLLLTVLNEARI